MNSTRSENAEHSSNQKWISNSELANQVISKYTGSSSSSSKRKAASLSKGDEEYVRKRARNNVAVKKSREKTKNRIQDTQERVEQLSKENEELQTKVTLLSKELNVLRALFTNGGFTLPCDLQFVSNSNGRESDHSPSNHSHQTHIPSDEFVRHQMSSVDPEKSAFHSPDEGKIPPLRPMPRVANTPSHKSLPTHPASRSYNMSDRGGVFNFTVKSTEHTKKSKSPPPVSAPPLLIQPGPSSVTSNLPYTSASQYKSMNELQHTSVIRSATELTEQHTYSLPQNTLGKFCIVQDPDNNGQIKIVPINS